jgi:hypothetical protein
LLVTTSATSCRVLRQRRGKQIGGSAETEGTRLGGSQCACVRV